MVSENVVCVGTFVSLGNVASSKYGIAEICSFEGNEVSVFSVGCGFCRKQGMCRRCCLCCKCGKCKKMCPL